MSDETQKPERLSHEWHAQECDIEAEQYEARAAMALPSLSTDLLWVGQLRDRAAKLRQAARDAEELQVLREYALDGDGKACEHCDAVCIPGVDDSEEWLTLPEGGEGRLCYPCSEDARSRVLAVWTKEAPDAE